MPVSIDQRPFYQTLPIGQQVIFAVSHPNIVANKFKVKFIAEVHVSNTAITLSTTTDVIGTFKTTPNNAGVGIFDLRPILETFVKPDYLGATTGNGSSYKTSTVPHPIHLIDKCSQNENAMKYFAIKFDIEFSQTATGTVIPPSEQVPSQAVNSLPYLMFNGVLQYDDVLTKSIFGNNYGYNLDRYNFYLISGYDKYLTNSPRTQKARLTDYGTLPFLNFLPLSTDKVNGFVFKYYNLGVQVGTETLSQSFANGGQTTYIANSTIHLMYLGAFPANLRGWSTTFQNLVTLGTIDQYTIQPTTSLGASIAPYTIDIICPNIKGYEAIRLTWLNQWGVWDYYTFNMKSTRSTSTKRIPYQQLGGTWNESTFKINGYKGGKKNFRVNTTEKIKLNTDFVSEAEGVWFEELINSTEVYIVNSYDGTEVPPNFATITNKYIEPVVLTTSSYVKKTIANDKLMQYTFEIEKSKMKRTQAV